MVAVKGPEAARFVTNPPNNITAVLLFGTDPGQVSERSLKLAQVFASREDPPGEVIRIDDNDLEDDSGRLAVELQTRPMFSGRKIVRATTGRRLTSPLIRSIIDGGPLEGVLIVEAGNLKPDDALRKAFEKGAGLAAIGCYPDTAADISSLITEVLSSFDMKITPAAHSLLMSRLGADRALSRAEIEKLALYGFDKGTIDEDDVDAIVGDASDLQLERIAEAAARGDAKQAMTDLGRAIASGDDPQVIILITQRYFLKLHRVRSEMDQGARADEALRSLRPPLHFKQRDVFAATVKRWSRIKLDKALERISETARGARLSSAQSDTLTERMILALAAIAGAR